MGRDGSVRRVSRPLRTSAPERHAPAPGRKFVEHCSTKFASRSGRCRVARKGRRQHIVSELIHKGANAPADTRELSSSFRPSVNFYPLESEKPEWFMSNELEKHDEGPIGDAELAVPWIGGPEAFAVVRWSRARSYGRLSHSIPGEHTRCDPASAICIHHLYCTLTYQVRQPSSGPGLWCTPALKISTPPPRRFMHDESGRKGAMRYGNREGMTKAMEETVRGKWRP
jgi:hypothetical protein